MIEIPSEIVALVGMIGSIGAAFGIVTAKVSRTESRIRDVNGELDLHVKEDNTIHIELVQRLTRIETKIDNLKGK